MGLLDRIGMVARSNLNALVTAAEDPEKILEQTIIDMQEDLVQLRQAVAQAMAAMKRQEQQYKQTENQVNEWERRAMLALQKGDDNLAREALSRKKTHAETLATLKPGYDQTVAQVNQLKKSLTILESKIAEAKTKKEMLKSRIQAAKAQENLNNMMGKINTNSASAAFERMEERVMMAEAKASATSELGMDNLESQFAMLESSSDVDDELMAMKARLFSGNSPSTPALNPSPVDAELEQLRQQMRSNS
ncbi:MAG: PspA/IM30 family protein [Cyanobacteria bacterium KgW148]|nr:PspA/IM30 family protein [Cyanobacteria bacterium KgW148]